MAKPLCERKTFRSGIVSYQTKTICTARYEDIVQRHRQIAARLESCSPTGTCASSDF